MNIDESRRLEHEKYAKAYRIPRYAMGQGRRIDAVADLSALPARGSYLDVSSGRGEMLAEAALLGFDPVDGTEIVDLLLGGRVQYAEVHALPFADGSRNVVTMFDVIEHLIPGDDERAVRELCRVASDHVILTANNRPSHNAIGEELHINRRPYDEWDRLLRDWAPAGAAVTWIKGPREYISETWRIDLA